NYYDIISMSYLFLSCTEKFYKGQIAEMLGGVDLSWLVGLLSTAVLYYVLAKRAQIKISKALQLERVK
ncbi:hypothetical protein RFZ52_19125, partial [Acinetobacter baumannii]|nr:hypothetical protein [Acinetobacter baumannii]MDQ9643015.1 hypothetical protein [Acinetobacter baumannii]